MRLYSITHIGVTGGTSIVTVIEATAHTNRVFALVRAWLSQKGSTTSAQQDVELVRKSAAGTNVTSPNNLKTDPDDAAFGGTVRGMATTEGTLTDQLYPDSFNWLNGWLYAPVPEERFWSVGAGIMGLREPTAPPAQTIQAGLVIGEIG